MEQPDCDETKDNQEKWAAVPEPHPCFGRNHQATTQTKQYQEVHTAILSVFSVVLFLTVISTKGLTYLTEPLMRS